MKKIVYTLLCMLFTASVNSQIPDNVRSYAIIGAFGLEQNAERFATFYKQKSLNTTVRQNMANNMFYVYIDESSDVEAIRSRVLDIREQFAGLGKAWLYNGNFNCLHIPSDQLKQNEGSANATDANKNDLEKLVHDVEEAELEREKRQAAEKMAAETAQKEPEKPKVIKPEGKFWVYFNTYNVTNLQEVSGNVKVYDAERDKEISDQNAHELITMNSPNNGTNMVRVETDIFGFQPEVRTLDLDEPLSSDDKEHIRMVGDSIVIEFPLRRFNKGDVMTLWKVYFYIDAAIMKEESVPQLNQLLSMMRENEKMRILIHGHTNGNSHGVVKHLDPDDKKFFSLNENHLEDKASAKKLSEFRAYTIQHWLMEQGIPEDRMEIKGWGGKKMIYDKHGSSADKNVRVEIEILEE